MAVVSKLVQFKTFIPIRQNKQQKININNSFCSPDSEVFKKVTLYYYFFYCTECISLKISGVNNSHSKHRAVTEACGGVLIAAGVPHAAAPHLHALILHLPDSHEGHQLVARQVHALLHAVLDPVAHLGGQFRESGKVVLLLVQCIGEHGFNNSLGFVREKLLRWFHSVRVLVLDCTDGCFPIKHRGLRDALVEVLAPALCYFLAAFLSVNVLEHGVRLTLAESGKFFLGDFVICWRVLHFEVTFTGL